MSNPGHDPGSRADSVPQPARERTRRLFYALLLTILAGFCCFYRLSKGTLVGDEAAFACTTDRMRATGDWVVPFIGIQTHLNATPLYNWLTLAVAPCFADGPLWHRFWSAAFGVGCVLVTFALGTLLFRAEVGLLAGLFLLFNRDFLFCHGIRFGGMEAMLAFFITSAICCYAWLQTRPARAWLAWSLLGLCIGLAWLSKPPVFGCFFFSALVLHHLCARRGEPLAGRVAGPLLALAVGLVVAAPWYVLLWSRLGNPCLHALFVLNSVERALDRTIGSPFCCHDTIRHASNGFKLVEAALACALGCWLAGHRRPQYGLLLLVGGSYLLALTTAGKAGHYLDYLFPLLSVLLAALFLDAGPHLAARCRPALGRRAALAGIGLAVVLAGADCIKVLRTFASPAWVHPTLGIYQRLAPEIEQQRCRLVLLGFPPADRACPIQTWNFEDLYYAPHMPLADRARDVKELTGLLEDGRPTIVLLPPLTVPQPLLPGLYPELRVEDNPLRFYTYPVLAFHGAAARLRAAELHWLCRGCQP